MIWWQLTIKALVSGALIAAASELARRSPGWGGLIASLPMVTLMAMVWLWRDTNDPAQIADLALSSTAFVTASLPAFVVLVVLLRRGVPISLSLAAFIALGFVGYLAMIWLGKRWGLPV